MPSMLRKVTEPPTSYASIPRVNVEAHAKAVIEKFDRAQAEK